MNLPPSRMGGIQSASIIDLRDVDLLYRRAGETVVRLATGCSWQQLDLRPFMSEITVKPEDDDSTGLQKETSLTLRFFRPQDESTFIYIMYAALTGAIVSLTYADGKQEYIGTAQYPATGSIRECRGEQPSDGSYLELTLTVRTPYSMA